MAPIVLTGLGKIRGRRTKTRCNRGVYSFRRVPYARPPLNELRFALPEPVEPWSGTLDCSGSESPACLQVNVMNPESKYLFGSEDCLYLNVFTPHLPGAGRSALFPVIVFLHGGAFCVGSNDSRLYGPDLLLDHGVVLVTVNYRLGPLGFFSLDCDECPGNQGCHDQVMALQWVHRHVGVFGGDNTNITLMGESAGGMASLLHLVSPLSRGLFHKVIAMSSSATTPFLHNDRRASAYALALSRHLLGTKEDVESGSPSKLLELLRKLPAKDIVDQTTLFKDWDVTNPLPWKPSLDDFASRPFLPIPFEKAVSAGHYPTEVPILAGSNSEEGLILSAAFHKSAKKWELLFKQWEVWAPQLLFNREADLVTQADRICVNKVREKFMGSGTEFPAYTDANLKRLEEMFSAAIFHAPLARDVRLLSESGSRVHKYLLTHEGSMTMVDLFRLPLVKMLLNFSGRHLGAKVFQKKLGVCHGDELFYLFPFSMPGFPNPLKTETDRATSLRMLTLWTNFAKFGDPTRDCPGGGVMGNFDGLVWSGNDDRHLHIGSSGLTMGDLDPALKRRIDFFDKLAEINRFQTSTRPVTKLHSSIAERRDLLDPEQLFS